MAPRIPAANLLSDREGRAIRHVYLRACESAQEARTKIAGCIGFYNSIRPHASLKVLTPDQVYFNRPPGARIGSFERTSSMHRRHFLRTAAMATAASMCVSRGGAASQADAFIEIMADEGLGEISPLLYGQFTEHIGGVIYDGVWVGEHSKIRNYHGLRAELVDHLKKIHVPIVRWPGGCFADSYNWRDGVGPLSKRPRRTNFWEVEPDAQRLHEQGPQIFESNEFGTDEFVRFCQSIGAEPYLAANVRSLPALEFDNWVEYCNSPAGSTSLADLRAEGGSPDPYKVRWWGVGNESWGCGGNFLPEDYASEFRRYSTWIPSFGVDLQLVGSGPNDNDLDWTHRFFEEIFSSSHPYDNRHFKGWSVHHYAAHGEQALRFEDSNWYQVLKECDYVEQIIEDQWSAMGQYDKEHRVRLVVDEYGPWYVEGSELDPTHIFGQQVTVRDALATALTLDAFNRHPEKVCMGTNAQLVNNINALFLCHEDKFLATPNYYVFGMYAGHQGGQALRANFSAPNIHFNYEGKSSTMWGLNGSASRKGNVITVTAVNTDVHSPKLTRLKLRGMKIQQVTGTALYAADMHAHNTFENPTAVQPTPLHADLSGGEVNVTVPAGSLVKLELTVG
jgi:alpha-N-arabinofuranosidase